MKIAINGFGRIGRCILRAVYENNIKGIEVVAINGPAPIDTHLHLLSFDSVHGRFNAKVEKIDENNFSINGQRIKLFREKSIDALPWGELGVDIVMECTGKYTAKEDNQKHLDQGAKKVIISAPAKDANVPTIVYKVNSENIKSITDKIISIGSCTTNCLAPVAMVLDKEFKIQQGFVTTVHSYTNDQNNLDASHKDLRRARACALSIVPTSTGAATALGRVLPSLSGKLDGVSVRVPTPNVSLIDLCCTVEKSTSVKEINDIMKKYSETSLSGVLGYCDKPLVSIDFNHSSESSVFDSLETKVLGGNFVRIAAWYDNEWAFSVRMLEIAKLWNS